MRSLTRRGEWLPLMLVVGCSAGPTLSTQPQREPATVTLPQPPPRPRLASAKAIEAVQTNTYRLGDRVRVEWKDQFYPAQIVEVVGKERYKVHYEGYGPEWDEIVGLDRVQPE